MASCYACKMATLCNVNGKFNMNGWIRGNHQQCTKTSQQEPPDLGQALDDTYSNKHSAHRFQAPKAYMNS